MDRKQGLAIELRGAALFDSHDDGADDADAIDVERAPICGACGVTTLAADAFGSGFACDNDECPLYGELIT